MRISCISSLVSITSPFSYYKYIRYQIDKFYKSCITITKEDLKKRYKYKLSILNPKGIER